MRIISKFRDYYDHVQSFGMSDVIYQRKKIELEITDKSLLKFVGEGLKFNSWVFSFKKITVDVQCYVIGLCGKTYPVIKLTATDKKYKKTTSFFYNEKDFHQYLIDHKYRDISQYTTKGHWWKSEQSKVKAFFDYEWHKLNELFHQHNVPIYVINFNLASRESTPSLILNHELKDFNFYTQMDTYKTFQEIEMFVSGVLKTPVVPTTTISDECMRDAKGFDRWSFKKMPTKKR